MKKKKRNTNKRENRKNYTPKQAKRFIILYMYVFFLLSDVYGGNKDHTTTITIFFSRFGAFEQKYKVMCLMLL
jgi:hypothetical protein